MEAGEIILGPRRGSWEAAGSALDEPLVLPVADAESSDDGKDGMESKRLSLFGDSNALAVASPAHHAKGEDDEPTASAGFDYASFPPWRLWCRSLVLSPAFERAATAVIIFNIAVLAAESPVDRSAPLNQASVYLDSVFVICFAAEIALKMAGLGLFIKGTKATSAPFATPNTIHTGGFFRSPSNILDLALTLLGFVALFRSSSSFAGLRAFRLLRLLRAASISAPIRVLVNSLIASVSKLLNVLVLYFFFVLVLAIIAIQLWEGVLLKRCVLTEAVAELEASPYSTFLELQRALVVKDPELAQRLFPDSLRGTVCHGMRERLGGFFCPFGYTCVVYANPGYGFQSFDNIGVSMLSLFVAVTLEGWAPLMDKTWDATSLASVPFFTVVVTIGAFFIINLTLIIIAYAFEAQHEREAARNASRTLLKHQMRASNPQTTVPPGYTKTLAARLKTLRITGTAKAISRGMPCEVFHDNRWIHGVAGELYPDGAIEVYTPDGAHYVARRQKDIKPLPEGRFRLMARRLTRHRMFKNVITALIVLNAIGFATDHHGQPQWIETALAILNTLCYVAFVVEALFMIAAFGVVSYFHEPWNIFDAFVIAVCTLEIILSADGHYTILRSLRIVRVLKLTERFGVLRRWVLVIVNSVRAVAVLVVLILLFVFSYATLGMHVIGGTFCGLDEECEAGFAKAWEDRDLAQKLMTETTTGEVDTCRCVPRASFDSIGSAVLTMFQVLTGEGWSTIMYQSMYSSGAVLAVFFVSFFFIGAYLLLNLFVAILLQRARRIALAPMPNVTQQTKEMQEVDPRAVPLLSTAPLPVNTAPLPVDSGNEAEEKPERALFCLAPDNTVRVAVRCVVDNSAFEYGILAVILASTVALAVDDPLLPPDSTQKRMLDIVDYVVTALFTTEAVLKSVAYGFAMHKSAYLRRDGWAGVDFAIVVASLLSVAVGHSVGILRVFRSLRPIRIINKSSGMRLILSSLTRSLPAMANVLGITLLLWSLFAILGVQLFKGKFYACTLRTYADMTNTVLTSNGTTYDLRYRTDCLDYPFLPLRWTTFKNNFDSLPAALLTLFEVASLEGWTRVMYLGMDAVSFDEAPHRGAQPGMAVYFVLFVFIGSFFAMHLFVAVLLDTYYIEEFKADAHHSRINLSEAQRKWVQSYREMLRGVAIPPEFFYSQSTNPAVALCRRALKHKAFDPAIQLSILLNVAVLATEHYNETQSWVTAQNIANYIFVGIFTIEAAAKLTAFGARGYFKESWNRFDFAIVCLSWGGALALEIGGRGLGATASVFRVLRLTRVLRLVKRAKGITVLLKTLFLALPAMLNVVGIIILILTIYAAIGVRLFGRLSRGTGFTRTTNFDSFVVAIITLVRVATGESWNLLLSDCRRSNPECDAHLDGCVEPAVAILYFSTFVLCSVYVLLNLFIAVILDSFEVVVNDAKFQGDLTKNDMKGFKAAWKRHDPNKTYRLNAAQLPSLMKTIGPPLGVEAGLPYSEVEAVVTDLDLHTIDGMVDMQPLLQALFCRMHGSPEDLELPEFLIDTVVRKADSKFQAQERDALYLEEGGVALPIHVVMGVIKMQAAVRGAIARERIRHNYIKLQTQQMYIYGTASSQGSCPASEMETASPVMSPALLPMLE